MKEAAVGMEALASAGFDVNEIMAAMPGMLDLAASGGVDLATAADIASSTLRGFGLEANQAAHVADVLARAAADTNAGIQDTGQAMEYVAPVARSMGLSLEEVTAAIGEMANSGIRGSQAGTTLRSALTRLANPSGEAGELMKKLGFSAYDSTGKMLPLKDIIGKLQGSMKGLSEQQKQQAIATIFGQEAMSGMLTLIQAGPSELDKLTNSFKNSDGSAKEMATTMKDNLKGAWDELTSAVEGAMIAIGDRLTPMLRTLTETINNLVNWFNGLSDAQKDMAVKIALIVAAIGPVLLIVSKVIAIVGGLITVFSTISGAITVVTTGAAAATPAIAALASVFTVLTGPVGIAIAIISAFAVAAYLIYKNWEPIKNFFIDLWTGIKNTFSSTWESIKAYLSEAWNNIKIYLNEAWQGAKDSLNSFWEWIKGFFAKWGVEILATIAPFIGIPLLIIKHWDEIQSKLSEVWNNIKSAASNIWVGIKDFFISLFTTIKNAVLGKVEEIKQSLIDRFGTTFNILGMALENLRSAFSDIWEGIKNIVLGAVLVIIDAIRGDWDKLRSDLAQILDNIKAAFTSAWISIQTAISQIMIAIKLELTLIWINIKSFFINLWNEIKANFVEISTSIKNIAIEIWTNIINFLIDVWNKIKNNAIVAWTSLKDNVTNIITSTSNWIKNTWSYIVEWFSTLPSRLYKKATDMFESFKSATKIKINETKDAIVSGIEASISYLASLPGRMYQKGADIFNSLKNGISSTYSSIKSSINSGIDNAINYIKSLPSQMYQFGVNIMQGLLNGIKNMIGKVKQIVEDLAEMITEKIRNALGIHSPSVVMEKLGGYTGEGFAVGLQDSLGLIKNAVKSMSSEVTGIDANVPSSKLALAGSQYGTHSISETSTSTKNDRITQPLFIIEKFYNNTDKDIENLAYELEFYRQRVSMGKGGS